MPNPLPINFTHNMFGRLGQQSWRGTEKHDNTSFTAATNVYPKKNNSGNDTKRTFGKARPIKHIRKGRYERGGTNTYNNSRLIYELNRPGGLTVRNNNEENKDCNGVSSVFHIMKRGSSECCAQRNALSIARRFHAGRATSFVQFRSHANYSNYFQGRNWSFEPRDTISGKNLIAENTFLKDGLIKKEGCGRVVFKVSNEKFGVTGAVTAGNYIQSIKYTAEWVHPNKNVFRGNLRCEVQTMKLPGCKKCFERLNPCIKVVKIFTIKPMPPRVEVEERRIVIPDLEELELAQSEPEPEPEPEPQPEPEPEYEERPISYGRIVNGYIRDATVNFYYVDDDVKTTPLATTITDAFGEYAMPLSLPAGEFLLLETVGGTSIATGLSVGEKQFKKVFKIPIKNEEVLLQNNTVNVLTSIVSSKVENRVKNQGDILSVDELETAVTSETTTLKTNLGLSEEDEIDTDFLDRSTTAGVGTKIATVNTMVNSLLNIVSGVQSFADSFANLTNKLTEDQEDLGENETLLDVDKLDNVVKSTLRDDVDENLANDLVNYTTQVKQVVDQVSNAQVTNIDDEENILESLEKMVKLTGTVTVAEVGGGTVEISSDTLETVEVFQIFAPQPEPEPEPPTVDAAPFREELLRYGKLGDDALGRLSSELIYLRTGNFDALDNETSQKALNEVSSLLINDNYFTFSEEEIRAYDLSDSDTVFQVYKIFAYSIIDGINSAIVLNKQNESLQTSNVQLNQFKNILQDPDLLNEYIENNYGGFRPAIMQVEHEVTSALQLAPEYSTYITRFGVPENGVFDSQKLELIRLELSNT